MNFEKVIPALRDGKKIRGKNWLNIDAIDINEPMSNYGTLKDWLEVDWEIFEEPPILDLDGYQILFNSPNSYRLRTPDGKNVITSKERIKYALMEIINLLIRGEKPWPGY